VAQRSGLLRAAAALHHLRGDYSSAIASYLARPGADGLFAYAERVLSDGGGGDGLGLAAAARGRFGEAVQQHISALIGVDAEATASLLVRRLPQQQLPVLRTLEAQPALQFAFLRAAFAAQERMRLAALRDGSGSATASPVHRGALPRRRDAAAATPQQQHDPQQQQQQQLDTPEVVDLYIRLLCRFAPSEVLPFLQGGAQSYDVRAAIRHCAAAGVADAEAYLHERLGDLAAALKLYLREVAARNDGLEAAVRAGGAPAFALPPQLAAAVERAQGGSGGGPAGGGEIGGGGALGPRAAAVALVAWLERHLGLPSSSGQAAATESSTAASVFARTQQQQLIAEQGPRQPLQQQQQQLLQGLTAAQRRKAALSSPRKAIEAAAAAGEKAAAAEPGASGDLNRVDDAAALAASWQIRGDRHLGWISALSPRARIHGVTSDTGAHHTPERVPAEVAAAWRAMHAAVAFCRRSSRDMAGRPPATRSAVAGSSGGGGGTGADDSAAQAAWFSVLDAYVTRLRRLKLQRDQSSGRDRSTGSTDQQPRPQQPPHTPHPHHKLLQRGWSPDAELQCALHALQSALAAADGPDRPPLPAGTTPATVIDAALASAAACLVRRALRDAYTALIDEVISEMTDHVPLVDIVMRILERHRQECFGEFRPTLLGLFGAYAYERAIMGAANSLVTKDAFQQVARARVLRARARQAQVTVAAARSEGSDGGGGTGGGGAVLGAAVASAGAVGPLGGGPSDVVQAAHRLGVLGRSVAFQQPRGFAAMAAAAAGGPTDRDLLVGMLLGSGHGLGLQLRPPPLAANLIGSADHPGSRAAAATGGAFQEAAQQAAALGDRFVGGCDLALEIAALQEHSGMGEHAGAAAAATAAAGGGVGVTKQSSFDLDEMLLWSQANT